MAHAAHQETLFQGTEMLPEGFTYIPELLTLEEEAELAKNIRILAFSSIEMHGIVAQRRAAHFGIRYSYAAKEISATEPIPAFLLPLRARLASMLGMQPEDFPEALINEYTPGSAIGWHVDGLVYDVIAGVSLLGSCTFKLRPIEREKGKKRTSISIQLPPRSAYVMQGEARWNFHHSIYPRRTNCGTRSRSAR